MKKKKFGVQEQKTNASNAVNEKKHWEENPFFSSPPSLFTALYFFIQIKITLFEKLSNPLIIPKIREN